MDDKLAELQRLHKKLSYLSNEIYFLNSLEKFKQNELSVVKNSELLSKETKEKVEAIFNEFISKIKETSLTAKQSSKELLKDISKITKKIK